MVGGERVTIAVLKVDEAGDRLDGRADDGCRAPVGGHGSFTCKASGQGAF